MMNWGLYIGIALRLCLSDSNAKQDSVASLKFMESIVPVIDSPIVRELMGISSDKESIVVFPKYVIIDDSIGLTPLACRSKNTLIRFITYQSVMYSYPNKDYIFIDHFYISDDFLRISVTKRSWYDLVKTKRKRLYLTLKLYDCTVDVLRRKFVLSTE